jgi:hypothetical protein
MQRFLVFLCDIWREAMAVMRLKLASSWRLPGAAEGCAPLLQVRMQFRIHRQVMAVVHVTPCIITMGLRDVRHICRCL